MSVTIDVWPAFATLSLQFSKAYEAALTKKLNSFSYKGATVQLRRRDGSKDIFVTLNGLDAKLPDVFKGELQVNRVVLNSTFPKPLKAQPGWYVGANFGFPKANGCCVDPKGSAYEGKPMLCADGDSFDDVVALFKRVMTGKLTPGYNGDPWDGRLYR